MSLSAIEIGGADKYLLKKDKLGDVRCNELLEGCNKLPEGKLLQSFLWLF